MKVSEIVRESADKIIKDIPAPYNYKKTKVKVYSWNCTLAPEYSYFDSSIQDKINSFMEKNPDVKITDIKIDVQKTLVMLYIFYKEKMV